MLLLRGAYACEGTNAQEVRRALSMSAMQERELVRNGVDHLTYQTLDGAGIVLTAPKGITQTPNILKNVTTIAGWYHDIGLKGFLYSGDSGHLTKAKPGDLVETLVLNSERHNTPCLDAKLHEILALPKGNLPELFHRLSEIDAASVVANIQRYDPILRT